MQLELLMCFEAPKEVSLRRAAILKTFRDEKVFFCNYKYLSEREVFFTGSVGIEAFLQFKKTHYMAKQNKKLYDVRNNEQVDIKGSSTWLTKGNNKAQDEARLCYLQDSNMFGDKAKKCPHCKEKIKSVDNLATQCDRMLANDYTHRHNKVFCVSISY